MDPEDLWDTVLAEITPANGRRAQRGVLTLPDSYYQSGHALAPAFDPGLSSIEADGPLSPGRGSSTSKGVIRNLQLATEMLPGSMGAGERASPSMRMQTLPPSLVPDGNWDHAGLEAQRWSPMTAHPHLGNANVQHMSRQPNCSSNASVHNSGSTAAGALRHKVVFDDTLTATLLGDDTPPNQFRKPSGGVPWARRPILRSKTVPKLGSPQQVSPSHSTASPAQWNNNIMTQQAPPSPEDTAADSDDGYSNSYRRRNDFRRARTYAGAPSSVGLDAIQMGPTRRRGQATREVTTSGGGELPGSSNARSRLSGAPPDGLEERSSWRPTPQWRQQLESKVAEMAQQRVSGSGTLKTSSLDRTMMPPNGPLSSSGRNLLQQHRLSGLSLSRRGTENGIAADADLPSAFGLVGRAEASLPLRRNPAADQQTDERSSERSSLQLPRIRNSSTSGF